MTEAEPPQERKRRLAPDRQRRRRDRLKAGNVLTVIECNDVDLAVALATDGYIDPQKDNDPQRSLAACGCSLSDG
jgi:hypothetical protein